MLGLCGSGVYSGLEFIIDPSQVESVMVEKLEPSGDTLYTVIMRSGKHYPITKDSYTELIVAGFGSSYNPGRSTGIR